MIGKKVDKKSFSQIANSSSKEMLNNQDLYKLSAFLMMVIDHIGYYFFPDQVFLRAIGRFSAPIWLFFCGYNYKDKPLLQDRVFYGAIFLVFYDHLVARIPNILITMIVIKLTIKHVKLISSYAWIILAPFVFITYPIFKNIFDFGTLGVAVGLLGYHFRAKHESSKIALIICILLTVFSQLYFFNFNYNNAVIACLSILLSFYLIYIFRPHRIELHGAVRIIVSIFSRHSLYLYCLHLIILSLLSKYIYG